MRNFKIPLLLLGCLALGLCSCDSGDDGPNTETPQDEDGFAKGADISWVTEMEAAGMDFYDTRGDRRELLDLLADYGINSVRYRVWVDPDGGWCSKEETLAKALLAHRAGMRIMIDFHYSDWWADPGQQNIPAAWVDYDLDEMADAVARHTRETLKLLRDNGVTPEWVQIGNETGNGMLWPMGQADISFENYATLNNAGYDAVKEVFPDAVCIVHLHGGDNNSLYRWLFDGLTAAGGRFDMIGMSLYPSTSDWRNMNNLCIANVEDMIARYDTEVMICEVGMPWDEAAICYRFLQDLIAQCRAVDGGKCKGVFYWEPESYRQWNGYTLGAFDNEGKPTKAMEAFLD
ncbi:MAG: arabinogalactan endo-1,4-beta-galactosidase [Alistipes sp.]|nr:arabinogalactan endo-1,4-beta-galactosidase [Alistipes sp.]